jgi:23S rRNA pseudouridine2604 synthase
LINKPLGIVSSQAEKGYTPAVALLTAENQDPNCPGPEIKKKHLQGLATAGRLDINSKGLLVFTQDGRIARQLIGEKSDVEKEYLVRFEGKLTDEALSKLRFGLTLDGVKLRRAKVERINNEQLRFVLKQGRKRQIRRMCEAVGLKVRALKRVRVGKVKLGKLEEGKWRWLAKGEQF